MSKAALGGAILSIGLAMVFGWQTLSMRAEIQRLRHEKTTLADQIGRLAARRQSAPPPTTLSQLPNDSAPTASKADVALMRSVAERDESISALRQELASSRATASELENKLLTLQSQAASREQQTQEQLATERANFNQSLTDVEHSLESTQNNLKEEKAKTGELESTNINLKTQIRAAASSAPAADLIAGLGEINRRREAYIQEIASRYRDISSEYRSLAGALTGRENQQMAPWNSAEVSRIQSAVASEEDDLRRLEELNAQAALLEKRLAKH